LRVVSKGMPTFRYVRECIRVHRKCTHIYIYTDIHTRVYTHTDTGMHTYTCAYTQSHMHAGALLSLSSTSVSTMPDNVHFSDSSEGMAPLENHPGHGRLTSLSPQGCARAWCSRGG
jgi:hypothetical protein